MQVQVKRIRGGFPYTGPTVVSGSISTALVQVTANEARKDWFSVVAARQI